MESWFWRETEGSCSAVFAARCCLSLRCAALLAVFPVRFLTQASRFRADGTRGRRDAAERPWETGVPGIKGLFCDFCCPWRCQAPRGRLAIGGSLKENSHLMTRPSHIKGDSQVRVSTWTKLSSSLQRRKNLWCGNLLPHHHLAPPQKKKAKQKQNRSLNLGSCYQLSALQIEMIFFHKAKVSTVSSKEATTCSNKMTHKIKTISFENFLCWSATWTFTAVWAT